MGMLTALPLFSIIPFRYLVSGEFAGFLAPSICIAFLQPSVVPLDRVRTSPHPRYGLPDAPTALSRSVTPSGATDWLRDRMTHLRVSNTRSPATMTPRSTTSVAMVPGGAQQEEMVKVIVGTVEEQEAQIQRIRVDCMKAMDKLTERTEKELSLRYGILCALSTQRKDRSQLDFNGGLL